MADRPRALGPSEPAQPINRAPRKERRRTQRERILAGVIDAVARDGYGAATIGQVIKIAGVSRPTFYEYFTDKNAGLVAALHTIQGQLVEEASRAVDGGRSDSAMHELAGELVEFARARPAGARVLLDEAPRGGPRALQARDDGIKALAALVDRRRGDAHRPGGADVPARAWIGGVYRLLASRLRAGQTLGPGVLEELEAWIDGYALALCERRWRELPAVSLRTAPDPGAPPVQRASGRGGGGLSRRELADSQRQRILHAVAHLAQRKGYQATTVADVTGLARVDNRAFYRLFADKQQAFGALHELLFRQIMAVTATGFLAAVSWEERVWEAARAFTRYLQEHPTMAYAALVDSQSGTGEMVARVEQFASGFTVFLQEGYQHNRGAGGPSALALQATTATVFELYYLQLREAPERLSGLVAHVTFVAVSPFIGSAAANELIDRKLEGLVASKQRRAAGARSSSRFKRAPAEAD